MRLMRHKRTGRTAVYDEAIIGNGNWEEVVEETAPQKPFSEEIVSAKDEISISITRDDDEGIEHQA